MSVRKSNKELLKMILRMTLIGTLVIASVLFTMFSHKHIWSQKNVLDPRIASSIVTKKITAKRGTIYDRNNTVIAQQTTAYTIVAYLDKGVVDINGNPNYVKNVKATAKKLKSVLGDEVNERALIKIMKAAKKSGKSQTELGAGTKRIKKSTMKKIKKLNIPGIGFIDAVSRYYPATPYSSNLIGFAAYDEDKQSIIGKLGLELSLNELLKGKDGKEQYQQTVDGSKLPGTTKVIEQAENGKDVVLTLDSSLQSTVETQLQKTMDNEKAKSAWCLVMEVETGKVLAWASYPTFDQNEHKEIPSYQDAISTSTYECGSVMKPFTYATAIDTNVYPYNKTFTAHQFWYDYDANTGKIVRVPNGTKTPYPYIGDALGANFGDITFDKGLAFSSNVGICELLANYINYNQFSDYLDKFGFFQHVDTPYVDQSLGVKNIGLPTDYLSTGFGQASSITALQLCQAYTAIFNDGTMVRPYVIDSIVDSDTGNVIKKYKKKAVGTPISAQTAKEVQELMSHVTDDGASGERFKVDGIDLLMKTGTGQIYNQDQGQYDEYYHTSSIMAAAPADDPKVMVYYGLVSTNITGYSAEPFKKIMRDTIQTYGISTNPTNETQDAYESWETYKMPSLVNHTVDYAYEKMKDKKVHYEVIGDGNSVTSQYPNANVTINSNDRVFVLTNGSKISMPNMTGWTRKDLTVYWQLTGISIKTNGYGKVTSQNVEEGTTISTDTKIELTLE